MGAPRVFVRGLRAGRARARGPAARRGSGAGASGGCRPVSRRHCEYWGCGPCGAGKWLKLASISCRATSAKPGVAPGMPFCRALPLAPHGHLQGIHPSQRNMQPRRGDRREGRPQPRATPRPPWPQLSVSRPRIPVCTSAFVSPTTSPRPAELRAHGRHSHLCRPAPPNRRFACCPRSIV